VNREGGGSYLRGRNAKRKGQILLEHGVPSQKTITITFTVIGTTLLEYFHVTIEPVNQ
jgi:hypothetical protein